RSLGVDELFVALEGRHARSYPIWFPMLAMDRIYYRGLEPLGATVLSGGGWRELSDHAGLLGEFRLPARSTDDRGASAPVNGSPSTPRAAPAAPRSGR
ncbi:MAG: endonuclease/exonuclease/phosphatase family protein, partial [Gammaproteobacteria bacterium]